MQSKKHSFLEQVANIGSGFIIAYLVWQFGINPAIKNGYLSIDSTLAITSIFTVISLIRGYIFRRIGNHFTQKQSDNEDNSGLIKDIEYYRHEKHKRKKKVLAMKFN